MSYQDFLSAKSQDTNYYGFETDDIAEYLYPFQRHAVKWALKKGRAALFQDCGLGKTPQSLAFADATVRKTNGKALVVTPLAVAMQFEQEAEKFGIEARRTKDGSCPKDVTITNYERLHHYNPDDFVTVVCDESSCIKNYKGERQKIVKSFLKKVKYRLLCTATAAPNDFIELGTSSEVLGEMGMMDMLGMFFKNNEKSLHPAFIGSKWTFKPHSEDAFWRWVCSWAMALRKPSDIGFSDDGYNLLGLNFNQHVVNNSDFNNGMLFNLPAVGLNEQKAERRATTKQRCELAAELCDGRDFSVLWGHYNHECDLLEDMLPDSEQVKGSQSDDEKEEILNAFGKGELKQLVIKPKIGAFGLNWQHCNHMTYFPSHSYEQYYQAVRRLYRFGQKRVVDVDIVMSDGEKRVYDNLVRKSESVERMFDNLIYNMQKAHKLKAKKYKTQKIELPTWIA